jgi:hypothetical protein
MHILVCKKWRVRTCRTFVGRAVFYSAVMLFALTAHAGSGSGPSPEQVAQILTASAKHLSVAPFTLKRGITCYKGVAPVVMRCAAELADTTRGGEIVYIQYYLFDQPGAFGYTRKQMDQFASKSGHLYTESTSITISGKHNGRTVKRPAVCYQGLVPRTWAAFAIEAANNFVIESQVPATQRDQPGKITMNLDHNPDCDRARQLAFVAYTRFLEAALD